VVKEDGTMEIGSGRLGGFLDKLIGGVGLRRGRTNKIEIHTGDTLDFWRVLAADKKTRNYSFMQK
jgi:hypothetical protein